MNKLNMLTLAIAILFTGCSAQKSNSGVAIMGGADGPTAIFISVDSLAAIGVAIVATAALVTIIIVIIGKRKKQKKSFLCWYNLSHGKFSFIELGLILYQTSIPS